MANQLIKVAELVYVPGIPAVVGRPAYCITHREIIGWKKLEGFGAASSGASAPNMPPQVPYPTDWRTGPDGVPTPSAWGYSHPPGSYPSGGGGGGGGGGGKTPIYKETKECFPEIVGVPGTPARVDSQAASGWNAGARSIAALPVGKQLELDIRDNPVAIMIGVAAPGQPYAYSMLQNGVVIRGDSICAIKGGIEGERIPLRSSKLYVRRTSTSIEYLFSGQKVVVVETPPAAVLHAYVLPYAMSDYVDNPKFSTPVEAGADAELRIETNLDDTPRGISLFHMVALGDMFQSGLSAFVMRADGDPITNAEVSVLSNETEVTAYALIRADVDGQHMRSNYGRTSYAYGAAGVAGSISIDGDTKASGVFGKFVMQGRTSMAEQATLEVFGIFPAPIGVGFVVNGGVLSGGGDIGFRGKAADAPYFGGNVKVYLKPVVGGWFDESTRDVIRSDELMFASDAMFLDGALLFAFMDGVDIDHSLDIYLIVSMSMLEVVMVDDSLSLNVLLELIMQEQIRVSTGSSSSSSSAPGQTPGQNPGPNPDIFKSEVLQYAVNAVTGALSRYENFGFSSFATVGGTTYAATSDGVYELAGQADAGDPLYAAIDFGASDNGSAQLKRLSSVYMGVATDGGVYIRVAHDGSESRVYKATSHGPESRALTAKGLTARHWRIGLEITDASYADLDNFEVEIGVSQRRLRSTR